MSGKQRDRLYAEPRGVVGDFRFDAAVAEVFPDMVARSVPGYDLFLDFVGVAARRYARAGTRCYDLGCSLGAATLQILRQAPEGCKVVAVDNSEAMLERCRASLQAQAPGGGWEVRLEDLRGTRIKEGSLVVLNFTLQFVPDEEREGVLSGVFEGLVSGGALVLADKLRFADAGAQAQLTDLHEEFKRLQGYSDLEIAQKRRALEAVLMPNTCERHLERLAAAGFAEPRLCVQALNFGAFLAVKP